MKPTSHAPLYALLVICFALWGGGMVAMKFAFVSFSITQVVFARVAMAAVVYLPLIRYWWPLPYKKGDWKYLGALVAFEPCLFFAFETSGMAFTTASQGGVIAACFPLCASIAAWIFLKEKLTRRIIFSMCCAVVGVAGASYFAESSGNASNPLLGNMLMVGAVLSSTGYAVCARYITQRYSFLAVSALQAWGGTIVFLPFLLGSSRPEAPITSTAIFSMIYLGLGVGLFVYLSYNYCISHLKTGVVALFSNLIPVFTLFFAFTLLNERLNWPQALCIGLTLGGVIIAAIPGQKAPKNKIEPDMQTEAKA